MARVNSDGFTRRTSARLPSAQELSIRMNREANASPSTTAKRIASGRGGYAMSAGDAIAAASLMDRSRIVSPFAGLPVAAQSGEFSEAREFFGQQDGSGGLWDEYYDEEQGGYDYSNRASRAYDRTTTADDARSWGLGDVSREPAPLTLVPTSTINPERPRTVAAGYDGDRNVLTVVFRDSTFYNYYDVSEGDWAAFKTEKSKGRFIEAVLNSKPRGTAQMAGASMAAREGLYRIARTGQWIFDGQLGGQTDRTSVRVNPTKQKKTRTRKKK